MYILGINAAFHDSSACLLKDGLLLAAKTDQPAVEAAGLLANNKIIGWYQGRMEFGPRALGSRSVLASPVDPQIQARLIIIIDKSLGTSLHATVLDALNKEVSLR
jgi:predicted NodU family carbamoyl transferase